MFFLLDKTMHISSLFKHIAAFIYDVFPIAGFLIVTSGIVLILRNGVELERFNPWFISLLLLEIASYYIYSWKVGGQTLGMRAWKIKIKPLNNKQLTLSWEQAGFRFLIGIVSCLLLGLGVYWKVISKNNQSWMDSASQSQTVDYIKP